MARKVLWNGLFVLVAVALGAALSMRPWKVFFEQRQRTMQSVSEMREAEHSRASLLKEKADADSAVGKERRAREEGFRRPEEIPIDLSR